MTFDNAMRAYGKGDVLTYFNELLRIETDKDDQAALEWVRRLYGSGQAEGLYRIKEEHRKPTAGFLNLNVLRSESGEAAFRHSTIWRAAGNEDEYLRWLEIAAEKGYV
jgi:TPR repeat protein